MYENFADNILLIGHKTRLTMLIELSSGISLSSGELAKLAGIKPQTASEHLLKLVEANLISVNTQDDIVIIKLIMIKLLMQSKLCLSYLHL